MGAIPEAEPDDRRHAQRLLVRQTVVHAARAAHDRFYLLLRHPELDPFVAAPVDAEGGPTAAWGRAAVAATPQTRQDGGNTRKYRIA